MLPFISPLWTLLVLVTSTNAVVWWRVSGAGPLESRHTPLVRIFLHVWKQGHAQDTKEMTPFVLAIDLGVMAPSLFEGRLGMRRHAWQEAKLWLAVGIC